MNILSSLIAVAATAWFGGWEWACLSLIACVCAFFARQSVLTVLGASLVWLALFVWSGDRRLFFPFAMQLAVQLPCLLQRRLARPWLVGGGGLTLLFLLIRVSQSATTKVLEVEAIVAAVILVFLYALRGKLGQGTKGRVAAGTIASVLAFIGLVF